MAKKSAKPQYVEPENESQDVEEPEAPESKPEVASKSEAIRQAIAAGFEGPQEGTAWIQQQFGIEITPSHFSAVKATEKKKGWTKKGKPGRKPKQVAEVSQLSAPVKPRGGNGEADLVETLEALKPLIASHGADRVKRLVDLLG